MFEELKRSIITRSKKVNDLQITTTEARQKRVKTLESFENLFKSQMVVVNTLLEKEDLNLDKIFHFIRIQRLQPFYYKYQGRYEEESFCSLNSILYGDNHYQDSFEIMKGFVSSEGYIETDEVYPSRAVSSGTHNEVYYFRENSFEVGIPIVIWNEKDGICKRSKVLLNNSCKSHYLWESLSNLIEYGLVKNDFKLSWGSRCNKRIMRRTWIGTKIYPYIHDEW